MKYSIRTLRMLVRARRKCRWLKLHWLWSATGILIFAGIIVLISSQNLEHAAQTGDYLSGFAGSLAFLWIIASFQQQGKELKLQRQELSLQREALKLQTLELKNMGTYAALEQVAAIIQSAKEALKDSKAKITNPFDLTTLYMIDPSWKVMFKSTNPQTVFDAWTRWQTIESAARQFLASLCSAGKLYLQNTGSFNIDYNRKDEKFFYIYYPQLSKIPHLADYAGLGNSIANFSFMTEPGLKSIQLAGLTAVRLYLADDVIKEEGFQKLIDYHKEKNKKLPKITESYLTMGST